MGPSIANIYHQNFSHNIQLIRDAVKSSKIMAVVKANAYGHGSNELSKTAIDSGCEYLGVAFVEEGIELRKEKIEAPILVFGSHDISYLIQALEYDLEITITSMQQIEDLKKSGKKCNVHIKVYTRRTIKYCLLIIMILSPKSLSILLVRFARHRIFWLRIGN